jgi:hypothetical protein
MRNAHNRMRIRKRNRMNIPYIRTAGATARRRECRGYGAAKRGLTLCYDAQ